MHPVTHAPWGYNQVGIALNLHPCCEYWAIHHHHPHHPHHHHYTTTSSHLGDEQPGPSISCQEVNDRSTADGGEGHPDVATATVADVIRYARKVGDKDVMSAGLGTFQVVPEGRREGEGSGRGRDRGGVVSTQQHKGARQHTVVLLECKHVFASWSELTTSTIDMRFLHGSHPPKLLIHQTFRQPSAAFPVTT